MHCRHSLLKFIGSIALILILTLTQKDILAQEIQKKSTMEWYSDFELAKQEAGNHGKYVMLYFSGSDWCKPCIQLNKNILDTETFSDYANGNFVPVKLDFPKMRKNKISKKTTSYNENLADKFNPNGVFPLLVFLDNNEKMVGFTGFTDVSPLAYVSIIQKILQQ
jgi:thioredoxin-related protein